MSVQPNARAGEFGVSQSYIWYVVGVLALVNAFNYMDRMILSVLLPQIKADLGFSDTQLGLLTGFAFAILYGTLGIPIAKWADQGTRKNIIALALTVWSAMTAVCGLAQNFWQMFMARVGVGVGEAGGIPPAQSLIGDYVAAEKRSLAIAVFYVGGPIGIMIGLSLGGYIGETYGWRTALFSLGMPGILAALLVWLTVKEPPRGYADNTIADHMVEDKSSGYFQSLFSRVGEVLKRKTVVHIVIGFSVGATGLWGLGQWLPTYFVRVHGFSVSEIGLLYGITYGSGAAIGLFGGGAIANRLIARNVRWQLLFPMITYALSVPAFFILFLVRDPNIALVMVAIASGVAGAGQGPALAAMQTVTPPRLWATSIAIGMFCIALISQGMGPLIVGALSDIFTKDYGAEGLRYAMMIVSVLVAYSSVHLYMGSKTIAAEKI